MTVTATGGSRAPRPSSLADVLDLVLDKGIVIDAYVRVSLVGIELLTIDARIVVASVDTYLRFAEAVNRLDLQPQGQVTGLPGLFHDMREGGSREKTRGALTGVKDTVKEVGQSFHHDGDEDDGEQANQGENEQGGQGRQQRRVPAGRQASRRGGSGNQEG